jgi:hypothetical protein
MNLFYFIFDGKVGYVLCLRKVSKINVKICILLFWIMIQCKKECSSKGHMNKE